jgi:uncharacterized membrane protein
MMLLPFHILAGVLALVFGYAALYAAKGGKLHRRSGMLFVYAMVTMSLTGALMAAIAGSQTNMVAGVLTFYFVTTALITVRRRRHARPRQARSRADVHLRHDRAAGQRWRHQDDPRGRPSGDAPDRETSVAHVFCDVGRCRLLFLGTTAQGAGADPDPAADGDRRAAADRRDDLLALAGSCPEIPSRSGWCQRTPGPRECKLGFE